MAIPGKFEITQRFFCGTCQKWQTLTARATDWTGDLRTDLVCTTPGCMYVLESNKTKRRSTKGNISTRPQVPLFSFPGGDQVILEDYECSEIEAAHFCSLFNAVLLQIPDAAREALVAHWQIGHGSPHVWLLKNRDEWCDKGWAACRNQGLSLCVVSTLIGHIPNEYVKTVIAHELGHTLFIAGREEHHCPPVPSINELLHPPAPDPLRRYRPEWLVWRLMESWGFDQPAMEVWMKRNLIDDAIGIRLRDQPISVAESKEAPSPDRFEIEKSLNYMVFPAAFEKYLKS